LQAFVETGDVTQLDQQLLLQVLSAAANAAAPAAATQSSHPSICTPKELQQLQQHLEDLSADACLLLLDELLPFFRPGSSISAGSSGAQSAPAAGQLSEAALGLLLSHVLLPKLQSLSAAASKSMLDCLVAIGEYWCCKTVYLLQGLRGTIGTLERPEAIVGVHTRGLLSSCSSSMSAAGADKHSVVCLQQEYGCSRG
jgi:hypothetical protein